MAASVPTTAELANLRAELALVRKRADALDSRRQKQIENQIAAINRLMVDGSYDHSWQWMNEKLAKEQVALDHALSELRGLADSLDESVIKDESERLGVYDGFVRVMQEIQELRDAS